MDKKIIDDNDIERRYLQGKLTPEELEQFETYLMTHPDLVTQLELDSVMYRIMPQIEDMPKPLDFWRFLDMPLRKVFAPIAASMIIVPVVVLALFDRPNIPNIQPVFLTNETYRTTDASFSNVSTLLFHEEDEVILLLLYPENELADDFNVGLRGSSGDVELTFIGLSRGGSGYVSVQLPASVVTEGEYLLEITPNSSVVGNSDRIVESIPIRVQKDS